TKVVERTDKIEGQSVHHHVHRLVQHYRLLDAIPLISVGLVFVAVSDYHQPKPVTKANDHLALR
ncbi:hypothetical protein, partial [uncultured Neisseria sp.]|uniref:hypothetical protein n=1 Tax=uncultured Neisseria sp. TaxID=237778 RepID=UPI0025DD93BD